MQKKQEYVKVSSYEAKKGEIKKVVLLYSGGLDTSVMIKWIAEKYKASIIALAIDIGIQNFPEGFAVSVPFRREGLSLRRSFFLGQASAIVEPIAAVIGVAAVMLARPILPYALAFAAGAMIYVTIEEIIPESQKLSPDIATLGAMLGFVIMMILDVGLGQ